jgi:hypothetical protein
MNRAWRVLITRRAERDIARLISVIARHLND